MMVLAEPGSPAENKFLNNLLIRRCIFATIYLCLNNSGARASVPAINYFQELAGRDA